MKYWQKKELYAKLAALFGGNKSRRRQIRDNIRFKNLISSVGKYDFPIVAPKDRVNIAFCFNGHGAGLAMVAIYSLLKSSCGRCLYNIYLVVDETVTPDLRKKIKSIAAAWHANVEFLEANNDFDKSNKRNWPRAVWYRMMLVKLLPNIDNIIYADIDTIFFRDLYELSRIDMGDNILAGVIERPTGYINSGVLVMNLKQIRKEGLYKKWISMTQQNDYPNPDQDVLNITADGRIIYLPVRYNFQSMLGKRLFQMNDEDAIKDLKNNLVVMHYSNWMKPWYDKSLRPIFWQYWWMFADDIKDKYGLPPFPQTKNG